MDEVKVFGTWSSPYSRRVEMALKLKGVEYEFIEEDLSNKSPDLLRYNPVHKKIPVLVHNGKPVAESLVILEYIDETWEHGPSILPKDPHDRAMARFWARFVDETCMPAFWKACLSSGEEQVKGREETERVLKFLDSQLEGKKFFGGDSIGLVDIAATFVAYWLVIVTELVGIELMTRDKFPNVCVWIDEYVNSSIVKETLPDRDKLAERIRNRFLKTSAAAS